MTVHDGQAVGFEWSVVGLDIRVDLIYESLTTHAGQAHFPTGQAWRSS